MTATHHTLLDQLVAKAGGLYSLPAVAIRVLELTENPQVDTRALKECIENDPALTTKVLRVVNSSLFGLSREVSDLNQALALLGTKPLKLLVLGFSLPTGLFHGVASEMLAKYWRHTLTKAVAARELSETVWRQPGDEAFLAGLLQDLGMLVLIQQVGDPYVEFLRKVGAQGGDLFRLEAEAIGFDHTVLSSRLLASWRLPEALVEAAIWDTSEAPAAPAPHDQRPALPQVLRLAEWVARLLADGTPAALAHLLALAEQRHVITAEQLEQLIDTLEGKVRQLADVLSLELPQGLDYRDVLVQSQQRLAAVAAEAAQDLASQRLPPAPEADDRLLLGEIEALSQAVSRVCRPAAQGAGIARERPTDRGAAVSGPVGTTPPTATAVPPAAVRRSRAPAPATSADLLEQLTCAVTLCRQARCALSLLLVSLEEVDDFVLARGVDAFRSVRGLLAARCRALDHPRVTCLPVGEAGFALILPDCDRGLAVRLANQLLEQARRLTALEVPDGRGVGISVGVASVARPPKNFPPNDLLDAAQRCLYSSYVSGGVVKSIEIY